MKKLFAVILSFAILLLFPVIPTSADTATEGYYTYEIVDDYAVITDVDDAISGHINIPSALGGYPVKCIGSYAFSFCSDITSIAIPNSVEIIDTAAFMFCDFTSVTMTDSVVSIGNSAFDNCDKLESIYISKNLTTLGEMAFYVCRNLNYINLPATITSIGRASFYYCENLKGINVDENNANYFSKDGVLFNKQQTKLIQYPAGKIDTSYSIPNTVTAVGENAFFNCSKLKAINIPDSVNTLENSAFSWCYNLTDIVVPNSVKTIKPYAFCGCTRLKSIKLPDGITTIVSGLFYECRGFTEFEIPDTVTTIEAFAFSECNELCEINIPDSVTQIGDNAFESTKIKNINIPASVKKLGKELFYNCYLLQNINVDVNNTNYCSVNGALFNKAKTELIQYPIGNINEVYTVPASVKTIGEWAFFNCYNIKKIELPQTLEKIGSYAFALCGRLEDVSIPDSVISIGEFTFESTEYYKDKANWENGALYNGKHLIDVNHNVVSGDFTVKDGTKTIAALALYWCYNLESITLPDGVITIGDRAFGNNDKLESVVIPASVVNIGPDIVKESPNAILTVYENSKAKDYVVANEIPYVEIKQIVLESNNVKLCAYEDVIPLDSKLDVLAAEWPDNENEKNIIKYDITLQSGENNVEPNGFVKIYLPVSETIDVRKCGVGYIDNDGNIVKIAAKYQDGYMVFETDCLATYLVFEKNYISGDINADESINNKDLGLLMQHLNDWDVEIVSAATDVNADGSVNNKDYGLLMQYINQWDVTLK